MTFNVEIYNEIDNEINNETFFRSMNERLEKNIQNLNSIADRENESSLKIESDTLLHFLCECSDENCTQRTIMTLSEYRKHHEARDVFTLIEGHNVEDIEKVIERFENYIVVEKFKTPTMTVRHLESTTVDNSN